MDDAIRAIEDITFSRIYPASPCCPFDAVPDGKAQNRRHRMDNLMLRDDIVESRIALKDKENS